MEKAMTLARVKSVAGVRIPDTALCNAAVDLLESCSPAFLCSHCLRTYIFGSLAVRGIGRSRPVPASPHPECRPLAPSGREQGGDRPSRASRPYPVWLDRRRAGERGFPERPNPPQRCLRRIGRRRAARRGRRPQPDGLLDLRRAVLLILRRCPQARRRVLWRKRSTRPGRRKPKPTPKARTQC
jgi:hypothetical protein